MKKYRKAAIPPFILFLMISFCLIFVYSMLAEWLYPIDLGKVSLLQTAHSTLLYGRRKTRILSGNR